MKIFGTGIDIIECKRFERLLDKPSFMNGVYTNRELLYISSKENYREQTAAGLFCAKEALIKACGVGILSVKLKEIEIGHEDRGKPCVYLRSGAKKRFSGIKFEISISHCKEYAVASVIAFLNDTNVKIRKDTV